jgi:protocatechuate 3,4-dioxygenase beta subunit
MVIVACRDDLEVDMFQTRKPSRRELISGVLASGLVLPSRAGAQELPATPACHDGDEPTLRQTEGPFFLPRSPQRAELIEPGSNAKPAELSGLVLTRGCRPLPGVLVDLWHADERGAYDERGYRYRGHVFTAQDGSYRFRTIVPAQYPGRTRHYHVRVQAPNQPVLTTQLYFPNDPGNRRDGLFRRELLMRVADASDGISGRFDFVLPIR